MEKKIGFNDLTTSLKVLVVIMWIYVGLMAIAFVVGFIAELLVV